MPDHPLGDVRTPMPRAPRRGPPIDPPDHDPGPGAPSGLSLPRFPDAAPPRRRGILPFILLVVLPTALGIAYYGWVASPQYVSSTVFALHAGDGVEDGGGSGPSTLMGAVGPAKGGAPVTQSYGVTNYIASAPAMLDIAAAGLDVRAILTSPLADPVFHVAPDATDERLLAAWRSLVQAQFEVTRGVITLTTRAFTPDASLSLAHAVLASSERLVNAMSERMHADSLRFAEGQAQGAEARMAQARVSLRDFRAATGVLDPARSSGSSVDADGRLRQDLLAAEAQAETLRASGVQGPMVAAALARARALRQQLMDAERQISRNASDREGSSWASVLERHDALTSELRLAERFHGQAVDLLQLAQANAIRQRIYLTTFVRPVLAGEAVYPNRWLSMLIVLGCALLAWVTLTLLWNAVRDQN